LGKKSKKMSRYSEFKIQGVFAAFQSLLIVGGCLFIGTILKAMGYPDRFTELPMNLAFIRNWGFLLIALPLSWVIVTIWLERCHYAWFSKRWTVATGVGLTVLLGWYLLVALMRAGSSLIQANA
jgi:hypothetical protein